MKTAGPDSTQHSEDIVRYTTCGEHCFNWCVIKVHIREGKIWAIEPDDTLNPGIPREDGQLSDELLRGAISSLRSCIADVFFLKIVFNDRRLLLAAS
jgi:anaerobic dimethyl sulfoxide reductase subunit A